MIGSILIGVFWVVVGLIVLYVLLTIVARFATLDTGYYDGPRDLKEQPTIAIVTGASSGIGSKTASEFAADGAHVIMCDRDDKKSAAVAEQIRKTTGNEHVTCVHCDLADLQSVKECALKVLQMCSELRASVTDKKWRVLLCNNAGVMGIPLCGSVQGYEMQYAVNFLGHFALTVNLLPLLLDSNLEESRVVSLSSLAHFWAKTFDFEKFRADELDAKTFDSRSFGYPRSKIAVAFLTHELVRRFDGFENNKMTAYTVDPGNVMTDLGRHMPLYFFILLGPVLLLLQKTCCQGAQTTITCCLSDLKDLTNGGYYADRKLSKCSDLAADKNVSSQLWSVATEQAHSFLTEDALAILSKVSNL